MFISNSSQIREADRIQIEEHHFPGIILMEEAGRLSTERILSLFPQQEDFLILAGPGNNGGDGLVIARHLFLKGKNVEVVYSHSPERYKGDAKINYDILTQLPISQRIFDLECIEELLRNLSQPPILIDALLGTGIESSLRGNVAQMIAFFQKTFLKVVAIDLPSGLDANTGECINEVISADYTLTFQLPKVCQFVTPASLNCGIVEVIDIGIWPKVIQKLGIKRKLLDHLFIKENLITRKKDSHKGSFGHILLVGGSRDMSGAISMTTYAALRSGVGLCSVFTPSSCRETVFSHCPEAMCLGVGDSEEEFLSAEHIEKFKNALIGKTAIVIGPGMGMNDSTKAFLEKALPLIKAPLLLDADALNILADNEKLWMNLPKETILTPHPGEMRRLMPKADVIHRRLEIAEQFAQEKGVTLVLKGAGSIVGLPDGQSYVNTTGNPGMGTGGSGDVLSGLIGGLMAQGMQIGIAAGIGVYLHGLAGDQAIKKVGMAGLTAMRLAEVIYLPE